MQPNYKLKDDHVITAFHGRQIYNQLDEAKLNKSGGVITGDIYSVNNTNPLNALATKQYVLDNAGSGGGGGGSGSHPDKIESQDAQKSTSVLCTTDGVTFSDDSTAIAIISKSADNRTQIKGELTSGAMAINSSDITFRSQDSTTDLLNINSSAIQTTIPILYSQPFTPTLDYHIAPKKYVDDAITEEIKDRDEAIAVAKSSVTQIVDKNTGEDPVTNNYKLEIDNNQLQFSRGATSEDMYLKLFGSVNSDGVVMQSNKGIWYMESDNVTDNENYMILRNQVDNTEGSMYSKSGQLTLRYGNTDSSGTPNAFCSIAALAPEVGSTSTRMLLYPKTTANQADLTNLAMFNSRLGYEPGTTLTNQNADSILKRSENDSRYYQSTTTLDGILVPQNSVAMNSKKITGLSDATQSQDAVNLDQLTKARQGFSVVRKITNTQTVNTKVSGFTIQQESNAQKCYWDNANQYFLVSIPNGDASVDVEFRVRITYNITATGNNATFVLRDFTNSTNYADTFLYASKQNQNGYFTENLTIIKNFTTNRFVGLYVTSQNGSPPFANLDIVMQAITITTSTQVSVPGLSNSGGTRSVSVDGSGLKADQIGQQWNLNGGYIIGSGDLNAEPLPSSALTTVQWVNDNVSATIQTELTNADFQRFGPSGFANAFAVKDVVSNQDRFIIQADIPANYTTLTVGQGLQLGYWGTKTLTNDSIMTKADVQALINAQGVRQSYVAYIFVGNYPPDSLFEYDSSPSGLITSITNTDSGNSVRSFNINHSAIPFRHRVFIQKYSLSFSTQDNDETVQYWVIDPEPSLNRTQTRICYEYTTESVTQSIGFNIQWVQW